MSEVAEPEPLPVPDVEPAETPVIDEPATEPEDEDEDAA